MIPHKGCASEIRYNLAASHRVLAQETDNVGVVVFGDDRAIVEGSQRSF